MDILRDDLLGVDEADRKKLAGSLKRLEAYITDLKVGRDRAERELRTQSVYVTTVCHEVRTQLGAVFSFADLLLTTELDATQFEFVHHLKSSAADLLGLINTVLDREKLSEGRLEIEARDFSVHDLIASVTRTLSVRCQAKGLRSGVTVTGDVPAVLGGDRMRISQVLMNLIDNAIKFTDEGTITLHVERLASLDERIRLRFSVRDTGIGIARENRESLFRPYGQGEDAIAGGYGGSGLGLAIATRIVDLMGGKIGCDSILGEGSIFWFTTPLELVSQAEPFDEDLFEELSEGAYAPREPLPPPVNADGKRPAHILLVEDNRVNQMLVSTYLSKFGYTFSVVESGYDAIEAVRRQHYDLILMDIHMPDLDGLQTSQVIRDMGGRMSTIPIIAVTANALHARRKTYLDAGMDACLTTPIDAMQLCNLIADHLQDPATRLSPLRAHNDDAHLLRQSVGLA